MRLRSQKFVGGLLVAMLLLGSSPAPAFETDQYNLPDVELADIGTEVADYTKENLTAAAIKVNTEINRLMQCLDGKDINRIKCDSRDKVARRLAYLRSDEAITREVYRRLGSGFIATTKAGSWIDSHNFLARPARYKTSYSDSIFVLVPTNYLTISPTVKMYGTHLGTDKIAHFFQQGYTYYRIYKRALKRGVTNDDAVKRAVRWGRTSEHTYYGTLVSGVFSNADLYANYVGMKFYEGLTRTTMVAKVRRAPTLVIEDGRWVINRNVDQNEELLKPFITNHMNEAMNPSIFALGLRSSVRKIVKNRSCSDWRKAFPALSKLDLENAAAKLRTWNDEDYGFKSSDNFVTIANTCF